MVKKVIAHLVLWILAAIPIIGISFISGYVVSRLIEATFGFDFSWWKVSSIFLIGFVYIATMAFYTNIIDRLSNRSN